MRRHLRTALATALATAVLAPASGAIAQEHGEGAESGPVAVTGAWARSTPGSASNGAAYLELANRGAEPVALVSVEAPVAERSELHAHRMTDGVMQMEHLPRLEIAPGDGVAFEPGGKHVMLIGLEAPLRAGDSFPLTLVFDGLEPVAVEVPVGDGPPAASHDTSHDHDH